MVGDPRVVPGPPAHAEQARDGLGIEAMAQDGRRVAGDDGVGRHVATHHRAGADDRPAADGDAGQDRAVGAEPDLVAEHDVAARDVVVRAGRRARPEGRERLERVGGHEVRAVVAERDGDVRSDRAEAPDMKPCRFRLQHPRVAVAVRPDRPPPARDAAGEVEGGEVVEDRLRLDHAAGFSVGAARGRPRRSITDEPGRRRACRTCALPCRSPRGGLGADANRSDTVQVGGCNRGY